MVRAAGVLGIALAAGLVQASAQARPSSPVRVTIRQEVGVLNEDDPFDLAPALGVAVGLEIHRRAAILAHVVFQGRIENTGRRGPIPDHRSVLAATAEWGPRGWGHYGEQLRIRLTAGALFRDSLATAALVGPGLAVQYGRGLAGLL